MLRKLAVTVVLVLGLVAALAVQADSVRAENSNSPLTVPVTAPVSAPIFVRGLVLYKHLGQVKPAAGAVVTVKNPAGQVIKTVTVDSEGKYSVIATGYAYYVLNASDAFGTVFNPVDKRIDGGLQLSNAIFVGKRVQ